MTTTDQMFGRQATSTRDLAPAHLWAGHLARAIAEALAGQRRPGQLARWVEHGILTRIAKRGAHAARMGRATGATTVRTVRTCHLRDGIVEVSVVIEVRGAVRALAFRMEGLDGRWLVTALELG